jgi:hypothetical protein
MPVRHPRTLPLLLALPLLFLGGSRATRAGIPERPDRLFVVSTADLKGRTSPCGCHTPKGGFARIGTALDSLRATGAAVAYVDAGGAFPDTDGRPDLADYMLRTLQRLEPAAVGVAPRDLRLGVAFLRGLVAASRLPVVCANLVDRASGQPLFPATRVVEVRGVRVGLFALLGERFDLGPARDSLRVTDAENAAHAAVASLRARGAQVVVLLSQLGKVGGEDLATAVPGIDAVVLGRDIPVFEQGRRVGGALLSYAGEMGQHLGVLTFTIDPAGRPTGGDIAVRSLGPEVRQEPGLLASVKAFEDAYNERMRAEQLATRSEEDLEADPIDRYVGGQVCARCHTREAEQWLTTAHSLAWETLVREKKDATPECIPCHVVGYRAPGGFRTTAQTPHLVDVQCENCHGMGTRHEEGWLAKLGEATCVTCHQGEHDPEFRYEERLPLVTHGNTSGESIRIVKARRERGHAGPGH